MPVSVNNINRNKKGAVPCHVLAVNTSPWGREALKKKPLNLLLSAILIKKCPSGVELLCISSRWSQVDTEN